MAINAGAAVAYLTLDHSGFSSGLKSAGQDFKTFMDKSNSGTERIKGLSSSMVGAGKTLTKNVTVPIVGAGLAASKAAIDFESAFTGVRKTVDGTEEQFAKLEKGIRNMAKTMPESASEIAGVAEAAGQLGIQTEKIEDFTKTMVMLGDSTNLSSEQAATTLARLANITGMSQDKFSNLGSVIVALGNNLATTESEITEMGLRLAGAGSQVGMTEAQIMSFAGALSSVGIEAEAGGSAFSKVMVDMQLAVETGGDSLTNFSKVAGMSTSAFKKAFKEDAAGAMIQFIKGLSETEKKGVSAIKVLDDMGITEVRMRDALLRAAGASDTFTGAIELGNKAWNENSALSKEAETRYGTTASKIAILKNKFVDIGITLGQALLPTIQVLVDKIGAAVDWFSNLDEGTRNTIVKFGLLAAAVGPVLIMSGKLIGSVTSLVGAGKSLVTGIGKVPGVLSKLPVVGTKIGSAFGKLGSIFKVGASATVPLTKGLVSAGSAASATLTPVGMATASMGELGLVAKASSLLFNPWTLGVAAVGVAAVAVGKKLSEDVVPSVDLFADKIQKTTDGFTTGSIKISDATKNAVGSYMEMDKKATESLMNMRFSGEAITADIANNLTGQFNEMSSTIITELDSDYKTGLSNLQSMFTNSSQMTSEEQQKALEQLNTHFTNQKTSTTEATNRINEIIRNAAAENRTTNEIENAEIDRLKNEMRINAVNCLSQQEIESNVIIDRMASYDGRVTAETAGEHVRLLEEQRIKAIDTANREYQERIAVADQIRAEGGAEAEETANKIIEEAERQRKESVAKANDIKEQGLDKLAQSYKNLRKEVHDQTGEILSWWDQLVKKFERPLEAKVKFIKNYEGSNVSGSASSGTGMGGYATGTMSALKGFSLVGENGPELAEFKGGERVYNAAETRRIANNIFNSKARINSDINSKSTDNVKEFDYKKLAYELSKVIKTNKQNIEVPVIIDGREVMRAGAPFQEEFDKWNEGRS